MKNHILIIAGVLGLAGLIATASSGAIHRSAGESGAPLVTVHFLAPMYDTIVNPPSPQSFIDSTFVTFEGQNPSGEPQDSTGVMELSFGDQIFSFEVDETSSKKAVDSLRVIWKVWNPELNLQVFTACAGAPGFESSLCNAPQGLINPNLQPIALDTALMLKIKAEKPPGSERYLVSGNLAVVVITIDPAEIPLIIPVSAAYKPEGSDEWVTVYSDQIHATRSR